jgi:hypothetical protein
MVVELVRGEKSGGYGGWKNGHVREKKRGKENGFFLWFLCKKKNDWMCGLWLDFDPFIDDVVSLGPIG